MPPKQLRKRQFVFNLVTRYNGEDDPKSQTMDAIKQLYNERDKANNMTTLLAMKSNTDNKKIMMLILFNDKLKGVSHQAFRQKRAQGINVLKDNGFICKSSSYHYPVEQFAKAYHSQEWTLVDGQILSNEVTEKCSNIEKEIVFTDIQKFDNKFQIANDFIQKTKSGKTAAHYNYLQNVEKQFIGNVEYDSQPEPMIDTLKQFCLDYPLPSFNADVAFCQIKEQENIYYQIFRAIVYYFLKQSEKKKRCIMLYGAPNSGKSTISGYLQKIFHSYYMRQPRGIFNTLVTSDDSGTQLVILDECDVELLFNNSQMHNTKQLLGGEGALIENKKHHPVTCFRSCYTIITSNNIPTVLYENLPQETDEQKDRRHRDRAALNTRVAKFKLKTSFRNNDKFPLTLVQLAHLLLYMADNYDDLPEPDRPVFEIFKQKCQRPDAFQQRLNDKDAVIKILENNNEALITKIETINEMKNKMVTQIDDIEQDVGNKDEEIVALRETNMKLNQKFDHYQHCIKGLQDQIEVKDKELNYMRKRDKKALDKREDQVQFSQSIQSQILCESNRWNGEGQTPSDQLQIEQYSFEEYKTQ